jgi:hypothetical protein
MMSEKLPTITEESMDSIDQGHFLSYNEYTEGDEKGETLAAAPGKAAEEQAATSNATSSEATEMLEQEFGRVCNEMQTCVGRLFEQLASYDEVSRNVLKTWSELQESELAEASKLTGVEQDAGKIPHLVFQKADFGATTAMEADTTS